MTTNYEIGQIAETAASNYLQKKACNSSKKIFDALKVKLT